MPTGFSDYHPELDLLVPPREEIAAANLSGPFYVTTQCIICGLPPETAPQNISYHPDCENPSNCRLFKQPTSGAELEQVFEAMKHSCVEAIRYRGTNPAILAHLKKSGMAHLCDAL
jgi:hypothetical protein